MSTRDLPAFAFGLLAIGMLAAAFGCEPAPAQEADGYDFDIVEYCRDGDATAKLFERSEKDPAVFDTLLMLQVEAGRCVANTPVGIRPVEWVRHVFLGPYPYVLFRGIVEGEPKPVWTWAPLHTVPVSDIKPPPHSRAPPAAPARERGI